MDTPRWFMDEVARAAGSILIATYVPMYHQKAGTDPREDLVLLQHLNLNQSHTLVDLGAGTGTFALAVRGAVPRVVGWTSRGYARRPAKET